MTLVEATQQCTSALSSQRALPPPPPTPLKSKSKTLDWSPSPGRRPRPAGPGEVGVGRPAGRSAPPGGPLGRRGELKCAAPSSEPGPAAKAARASGVTHPVLTQNLTSILPPMIPLSEAVDAGPTDMDTLPKKYQAHQSVKGTIKII